jgi:DNA topoisomerase-2
MAEEEIQSELATYDVTYETKTEREHMLSRPDMYGGSNELVTHPLDILTDSGTIEKENVEYSPLSTRLFFEALDNLRDAITEATKRNIKVGRVAVNLAADEISVYNEGIFIPARIDKKSGKWEVARIFGDTRTSSNYDDTKKREIRGRNGYGAKLIPVYSKLCRVEAADPSRQKLVTVTWHNNAETMDEPIVTSWTKTHAYTRVTWSVSSVCGVDSYSEQVLSWFAKQVIDTSFAMNTIVFLNDEELDFRGDAYLNLFPHLVGRKRILHDDGKNWILIADTPNEGRISSFVNGGSTESGIHVKTWMNHITEDVRSAITKMVKEPLTKGFRLNETIRQHVTVFILVTVSKPSFSSQTKEELVGPAPVIPKGTSFAKEFETWAIIDEVKDLLEAKILLTAKKTDGKRGQGINVPKAQDAPWASTKDKDKAILILVEGDSAKSTVIKGVNNDPKYGIYPLKGKIDNVIKDPRKLITSEVIGNIKRLLGVKADDDLTDPKVRAKLRYGGGILLLTDADPDGIHIRYLALCLAARGFQGLLEAGMVSALLFAVVIATKGKTKIPFYTLPAFEDWLKETNGGRGYKLKYFKGLGTCTDKDIAYAFDNPLTINYVYDDKANDALNLAFSNSKGRTDDRKQWMLDYDPEDKLVHSPSMDISTGIYKELILYAIYATGRAIPSLDGLAISQRKVIHTMRLKNLIHETKVAQLAGIVADCAGYHHGEASMEGVITKMTQRFPGTNNLPLLQYLAQLGTRREKGADAASSRYTYTALEDYVQLIFTKEDDHILHMLKEDKKEIEPLMYNPVVPIMLMNSVRVAIGVGHATVVPAYNPKVLLTWVKKWIKAKKEDVDPMTISLPVLIPWYRYYRGEITRVIDKDGKTKIIDRGAFKQRGGVVTITEVPIHYSFDQYKEKVLDVMVSNKPTKSAKKTPPSKMASKKDSKEKKPAISIKKYDSMSITLKDSGDDHMSVNIYELSVTPTFKSLKLQSSIATTQLTFFNEYGKLMHFDSPENLLHYWCELTLKTRTLLKEKMVSILSEECATLTLKATFVQSVIDRILVIEKRNPNELEEEMRICDFPLSFLDMPLASIKKEKVDKLLNQRQKALEKLETYEKLSPEDLWLQQIKAFEDAYDAREILLAKIL